MIKNSSLAAFTIALLVALPFVTSPLDRSVPAEEKNQISPEALDTIQGWIAEVITNDKGNR